MAGIHMRTKAMGNHGLFRGETTSYYYLLPGEKIPYFIIRRGPSRRDREVAIEPSFLSNYKMIE